MKSGVKGFWNKQKNVIRRYRSSTIVSRSVCVDLSKIDNELLRNVHFGSTDFITTCLPPLEFVLW